MSSHASQVRRRFYPHQTSLELLSARRQIRQAWSRTSWRKCTRGCQRRKPSINLRISAIKKKGRSLSVSARLSPYVCELNGNRAYCVCDAETGSAPLPVGATPKCCTKCGTRRQARRIRCGGRGTHSARQTASCTLAETLNRVRPVQKKK